MSAKTIMQNRDHITMLDPSEKLRPEPVYAGKLQSEFRNYAEDPEDPVKERIRKTYETMHTNQTVDFVQCRKLEGRRLPGNSCAKN